MPEELPTFASLQPRCLNRARDPYSRMEAPVISTVHLPHRERQSIAHWTDTDGGVRFKSENYWAMLLVIEDGARHSFGDRSAAELPVLSGIVDELAERGFSYLLLDPDGMRFSDLPLFEDDTPENDPPLFDNTQAFTEGWALFNDGELQRIDEADTFASDEAALAYVQQRAADGSAYHQAALNWTKPQSSSSHV